MEHLANQAFELIARIRYQCGGPAVTTMGPCANGCGGSARGAGRCAFCLGDALSDLIGQMAARELVFSLKRAQRAIWAAEEKAESIDVH